MQQVKKFVSVIFSQKEVASEREHREYTYLTDLDFKEGDMAVVESGGVYKVVEVKTVRGLTKTQREKAHQWVVAKVDVEAHKERMRKAQAAQEIRNKLQEMRESAEELLIYKALAQSNPEIQALLTELAANDDSVVLIGDAGADALKAAASGETVIDTSTVIPS